MDEYESLKRENAELRDKLARATAAAEMYKLTANHMLKDIPCPPMTEEELQEMKTGPRGRPPLEMIEEFERENCKSNK